MALTGVLHNGQSFQALSHRSIMHREPRRQLSNAAFASHSPHIKLASPKEAASTTRRDTWSLTGRPGTAGLLATSPRSRMAACGGPRDAGDASARLSVEKLTKLLQASPALPTEGRPGKGKGKGKSGPRRTRAARAAALGKGGGGGGAVAAVPLEESLARQASAAAGEAGSSAVLEGALAAGEVGWLAGEDGYEWRSLAFRDGGMTVYACAWARTWCPSARPFATLPLLPCPRPLAIRPAHLASLMHHRESAIAVVATAYSYAPARVPSPPHNHHAHALTGTVPGTKQRRATATLGPSVRKRTRAAGTRSPFGCTSPSTTRSGSASPTPMWTRRCHRSATRAALPGRAAARDPPDDQARFGYTEKNYATSRPTGTGR